MARNEKSAGGGAGSDSTAQTGIETSTLAYGSEGDYTVARARPTDVGIAQAAIAAQQIAFLADRLSDLCQTIVADDFDDKAGYINLALTASFLASQVGWLADLATQKLDGGAGLHGGAENWMCPPIYHDLTRGANGVDHE
jgi:hypothetical protein